MRYRTIERLARITALQLLALASVAQVQTARAQNTGSVETFHLPPPAAAPTPTPTSAGPIDKDHPVAAPTHPAPVASLGPALAAPTQSPLAPASVSSAKATPTPHPERSPSKATQSLVPKSTATSDSSPPLTTLIPAPSSSTVAPPAAEQTPGSLPVAETSAATEPANDEKNASLPWLQIAGVALIAALLGGFLYWRSRIAKTTGPISEPTPLPVEQPQPSAPAAVPSPSRIKPNAQVSPPPPPAPVARPEAPTPPVIASRPLDLQLEARHLSRAMVNATLAYRLTLTNRSPAPLGPLGIAGDITSAHSSVSPQEQLSVDALPAIHQVPSLAPGESVTLSGELRLPIASILPIHSGPARVFVPLARFRIDTAAGETATRVFVVGQESTPPGGALQPFALDRGPGVERGLGQRELELPA